MSVTGFGTGDRERRAWRSVFQDGLWDIGLGIASLARFLKLCPNPTPEAGSANS